jgi:C4-dicarboxylate transporter DctQ subunit
MKKFLQGLDKWIVNIVNHLLGIAMILLTLFVFVQVLIRYVFKVSMGAGISELPVYIMICAVWLGGVILSRANDHIKIDLKELLIRNKAAIKIVDILISVLLIVAAIVFTILTFKYLQFSLEFGEVTPGLQMPMWWLILIMFISWVLITVYLISNLLKEVKRWKQS